MNLNICVFDVEHASELHACGDINEAEELQSKPSRMSLPLPCAINVTLDASCFRKKTRTMNHIPMYAHNINAAT